MKQYGLALIVLAALLYSGASFILTADRKEEEYKVYARLLNAETAVGAENWHTHQPIQEIVIYDHTTLGWSPGGEWSKDSGLTPTFETVKQKATLLETTTWDDFSAKNTQEHKFEHCINFKLECRLISLEDYQATLADGGWEGFFKRYPNSQGIAVFSRVGFNTTMTQALVCYRSDSFMGDTGGGFCYLLEKTDGVWIISQSAMIWIS